MTEGIRPLHCPLELQDLGVWRDWILKLEGVLAACQLCDLGVKVEGWW